MENTLGAFIRQRRKNLGLTQEQLAERVGEVYTQGDISRIERGNIGVPRLGTLASLAEAVEASVGDLLIASGWFNEGHLFPDLHSSEKLDHSRLEMVLSEIEAELEAIRDLERQAEFRARRLSTMIRDLKVSSNLSVNQMAAD